MGSFGKEEHSINMFCKILAFFMLPCIVISFKTDIKPAFEGESADLVSAIQALDKIAVEINRSESSDRNQCQDAAQYASNCPGWKWACTDPRYISFMHNNCQKTCDQCIIDIFGTSTTSGF